MRTLATLLLLFSSFVCFAQTDISKMEKRYTWGSLEGGFGTLSTSGGLCARVGISHQRGNDVFTFRAFQVTEIIGDLVEPHSPRPEEQETEFAFLYGRNLNSKSVYSAFSIGLGYINSHHRGKLLNEPPYGLVHEVVSIVSIGIALDAQIFFTPFRYFGLGLSLAGNVNTTRSFGGVLICIQFGDID